MSGIANQLRTKQGAIIGAGVIIVITAITIWSWKSTVPNKKDGKFLVYIHIIKFKGGVCASKFVGSIPDIYYYLLDLYDISLTRILIYAFFFKKNL